MAVEWENGPPRQSNSGGPAPQAMGNLLPHGLAQHALARHLEQRRNDLGRLDEFSIKTTRVSGFQLVQKAGEVIVDVSFPVLFTERPAMSFGAHMDDGQVPEALNLPTVSTVVLSWIKAHEERVGGGNGTPGWFSGARLAIVTTGRADHKVWVHWQAEGKAVRNPAQETGPGQT
ncbi:MAG: hypothetical protein M3256_27255 [Actinomycetota bacterium]|nr:hypothetical protein [Actinomycetota bacterium]